ncbi:hypothetical protein L202_08140 [Cryptococcus amylolentus CBS 6039]|uniref:CFEM domain-containing protein n=2 Tax=Cryptococcus amylolentus TaxID=104669 RepID=A0A1E3HB72_9TREE|nr:hypothetical protein L202_08140 [Cryptococcus amylolentus CBS 6039]ODN72701.1 hypothetical protein L202_08140 [Cryptococcus amylolentus CBS 6039]ODN97909.1 hypothetical protein I350_07545 [Cryptococcus amylolentus CBS 6273]
MKISYVLYAITGLTLVLAADNSSTTLTECQTNCSDTTLASNSTCGSSFSECACDNIYAQAVKACLYGAGCKTDVSTWFDSATSACEAIGGDPSYSSTSSWSGSSSNSSWSHGSSSSASASETASGTASSTDSAAASSGDASSSEAASSSASASSSSSSSGASAAQQVGAAALAMMGVVVGTTVLL